MLNPIRQAILYIFTIGCIVMVCVSSYYVNNYTVKTSCVISDISVIDSSIEHGYIIWYFQYEYHNVDCNDTIIHYVSDKSYTSIISEYEYYSNLSSFDCYYYKNTNHCAVYTYESYYIIFMILIVVFSLATIPATIGSIYNIYDCYHAHLK